MCALGASAVARKLIFWEDVSAETWWRALRLVVAISRRRRDRVISS